MNRYCTETYFQGRASLYVKRDFRVEGCDTSFLSAVRHVKYDRILVTLPSSSGSWRGMGSWGWKNTAVI